MGLTQSSFGIKHYVYIDTYIIHKYDYVYTNKRRARRCPWKKIKNVVQLFTGYDYMQHMYIYKNVLFYYIDEKYIR